MHRPQQTWWSGYVGLGVGGRVASLKKTSKEATETYIVLVLISIPTETDLAVVFYLNSY